MGWCDETLCRQRARLLLYLKVLRKALLTGSKRLRTSHSCCMSDMSLLPYIFLCISKYMKNEACVFSCSGFKIKTFDRDLSKSVLIASVFYCSSQQSSQQSSHDDDSSRFLSPHMRDDRYVCSCSTRGNSWKHSVKSDGLGWLRPHFPSVSQLFNQKCHILKKAWLNRSYQLRKKGIFFHVLKSRTWDKHIQPVT